METGIISYHNPRNDSVKDETILGFVTLKRNI